MLTKEIMLQAMHEAHLESIELQKIEDERYKSCKIRSSVDELFCLNDEPHNCPLV